MLTVSNCTFERLPIKLLIPIILDFDRFKLHIFFEIVFAYFYNCAHILAACVSQTNQLPLILNRQA